MKMEIIRELDVVALLKEIPQYKLMNGQVGTIVHKYNEDTFEVEFADLNGETIAEITLHSNILLLLHYKREYV